MANKIRERAESDVRSTTQSETTEARNESAEDERIPEPEIITSEQADESPKQESIAKDEPADLPNFSNTPLQRYYQHILENIRR